MDITVETVVNAPMTKVWDCWTKPEHIVGWAFADDSWEAPTAENDLRVGGKFKTAMRAKDKSAGFDFSGIYTAVKEHEFIEYKIADGRKVKIVFAQLPEGVKVTETFEAETANPPEMQRNGWQGFMNNFKKYVEG